MPFFYFANTQVDDVNDNDPEPVEFCDREAPMTWDSSSGNVVLNFVSDGTPNNFDGGFTITQTFLECPEPSPFLYEVGEYGEVGSGYQWWR